MDKILFSNSFKNLMVALGAKTSDSSYAVPLINKTSGAPQGYMEMSALASVLGGTYIASQGETINIETAEPGLYRSFGSKIVIGTLFNDAFNGFVEILKANGSAPGSYILVRLTDGSGRAVRTFNCWGSVWRENP